LKCHPIYLDEDLICSPRNEMEDDELLRGLGVTARGEREVAKEVIYDAALAAAARAAAARRGEERRGDANATAGGGGVGGVGGGDDGEDGGGGAGGGTRGGGGGGGGNGNGRIVSNGDTPALNRLSALQGEADKLTRELSAVQDALSDVKAKSAEGTAPPDAPLIVAVGERRIVGLTEKRDALTARISGAEADAAAEASAAAAARQARARAHSEAIKTNAKNTKKNATAGAGGKPPPPAPVALVEDDDLDTLLDSILGRGGGRGGGGRAGGGGGGGGGGESGETERERLIRTGVLTPFDRLDGYDRRVKTLETTAAAVAGVQAWKAGRSRSRWGCTS
jgi:DNA excision repair protein ERCC-6